MEIKCKKGEQVILTDNCSQTFFGIVKTVNHDLGRIVLSDVIQLPEHKIITGYRNFDKNEIVEIKKYEENEVKNADVEKVEEVEKIKQIGTALSTCRISEINKVQSEYHYIKNLDTNFYSSIQLLKSSKKVGLIAKDTSKGRCSRASVIAFSTPSNIFVFDLLTLQDDKFYQSLKEILESSEIIKVVHDCRLMSDCLKHKHLINLEGVRDVEAEDIMVVFQQRKMIRKHRRSLDYLIKIYMGVDVATLSHSDNMWNERPLPRDQLDNLVSLVSYLIPLQEAIEQTYIQRLIDASNVYNSYLRSLDFFEFLHDEHSKTLRKQINTLLVRQTQARAECLKENTVLKKTDTN